jgi:hypothetical protein
MVVRIKAHFDGKTIVPDEPIDLPVGAEVTVEVPGVSSNPAGISPAPTVEERLAALDRLSEMAVQGVGLPREATRRENLYDD